MSKVKVRFPNESYPTEIENFKWDEFKLNNKIDNTLFGWYCGTYIAIEQ